MFFLYRTVWQCLGEVMTIGYVNFPRESCPNVSSPCWIPQADGIINRQTMSTLPQCNTFEKYICMLSNFKASRTMAKRACVKSCTAESYKIQPRYNEIETFSKVSRTLSFIVICINNTFTEGENLVNLCKDKVYQLHSVSLQGDRATRLQRHCGVGGRVSGPVSRVLILRTIEKTNRPHTAIMDCLLRTLLEYTVE